MFILQDCQIILKSGQCSDCDIRCGMYVIGADRTLNYDISDIEADESDFSRSYVKDTKPVEISITDNPETHMKKPSLDSIIKHSELKNPKN